MVGRLTASAAKPPREWIAAGRAAWESVDCESAKPVSQANRSQQLQKQQHQCVADPTGCSSWVLRRHGLLLGRSVFCMPFSTCSAGPRIRGIEKPADRCCCRYWKPPRMASQQIPACAARNPRLSSRAVSVSTTNPLLLPFRSFWTASGRADSKCHLPPHRPSGVAGHLSVKTPIS